MFSYQGCKNPVFYNKYIIKIIHQHLVSVSLHCWRFFVIIKWYKFDRENQETIFLHYIKKTLLKKYNCDYCLELDQQKQQIDFCFVYSVKKIIWETKYYRNSHKNQINDKQEAHGPHRSPVKPVNLNKLICSKLWLYQNVDLERRKTTISFFIIKWSFFAKHWVPFT